MTIEELNLKLIKCDLDFINIYENEKKENRDKYYELLNNNKELLEKHIEIWKEIRKMGNPYIRNFGLYKDKFFKDIKNYFEEYDLI